MKYEEATAERYIESFKSIVAKAGKEYEYEPPSQYYRDGYNLYKQMEEKPEDYVLFLRDPSVPPTDNIALCELFSYANFPVTAR